MISYYAAQKGCIADRPQGFVPYEYTNVAQLAKVICQYTWSPIVFKDQYRVAANFDFADLCALDIDNDDPKIPICTVEDIKREFIDCKMVIGTSRNHQKSKNGKPPQDRFRVIIPFDTRITSKGQYEASMRGLMGMFPFLDKACVDAARLFFPCSEIIYAEGSGETIPVADYKETIEDPIQERANAYRSYQARRRSLPNHIVSFIQDGKVFAGSRNSSVYISACYLIQKGFSHADIVQLIQDSPFDRRDFCDKEIIAAIKSASKKQ